MQIHRILVSVNRLDRIETGAELAFGEAVALLDEGDAVVARLSDGTEHLLLVRNAHPDSWRVVSETSGTHATLDRVGPRALRITLE